jgi:hypothetical protein
MIASEDIVIGEISTTSVLLAPIGFALLLALGISVLAQGNFDFRAVIGVPCAAVVLGMSLLQVRRRFSRGTVGLFIRDGVLHDTLAGTQRPLDTIRFATRESRGGSWLRTAIVLEVGPPPPAGGGYWESSASTQLMISTGHYKTPAAVMLERLAAAGVKVKGSKTAMIGI